MVSASVVVDEALKGKRIGTPYEKLDCQALVEQLLTDAGVSHPNWRGSNHMFREAIANRYALPADRLTIPEGSFVFTLKHDGGEVARGYHDDIGNATHVGLYLREGKVIHSTTGGVQWDVITSYRWTHYGLCKLLSYDAPKKPEDEDPDALKTMVQSLLTSVGDVERILTEMEEYLDEA